MTYKIIALAGKAGTGKDTILRKAVEDYPELFNGIISYTTRPPREGEEDGKNYHFVSTEEFAEKLLNGNLIEATLFNHWGYGTSIDSLDEEKINIGVFNPEGLYILLDNKQIDLTICLIETTDKIRLIRQLNREEEPDCEEIIRRYYTDEKDFKYLDLDNYTVIRNEKLEDLDNNVSYLAGLAMGMTHLRKGKIC